MVARITIVGNKPRFAALHRDVVQTLQEIRKLLQYWEELFQKVVLLFTKKSVHNYAAHHYRPGVNLFCSN